ncbi:GntR family transcriptional regulator [Micromonospora sp. WMMD975]|uniref:TetR/AcrR family transcriptional regulator C-terminal domain-containing protein n=1 Tax=Micromonospora sp. WMMD975 TaxID=3016087 RepID=UPI00249B4C5F|nr:GntR family transcriptional regulator [Micromonospora sp. WMMD975]WFE32059.1 TetR/AcrR family transcriptional regulator C-terminal domain-containing protein [Micromonospora sp. WMMD975]
MSSDAQPQPPYRRIAGEIEARIRSGDLQPGDRLPSIRQIADRWGIAIATATRVLATLRDDGLVETRVGSGTVVAASPDRPRRPSRAKVAASRLPVSQVGGARQALSRDHLLRTAIAIADVEGAEAVSMRRVAAELGVGTMSLYRHIANKEDLVTQMADLVFAEAALPDPGPEGWRAKLELVARRQWALCWRHLWLPRAISFTRPSLAPNMMLHTEWTLRALDGLGLSLRTRMQEALALHSLVVNAALSTADEVEAEQETGVTLARWLQAQRARTEELLASGRFPLLAKVHEDTAPDLDEMFEYSLARHLDGFAVLLGEPVHDSPGPEPSRGTRAEPVRPARQRKE